MLASFLFATLAVVPADVEDGSKYVENQHFFAFGWSCGEKDCRSDARQFDTDLRFNLPASQVGLDRAKKLDTNWSVRLECTVVKKRLDKCKIDDTDASVEAQSIAFRLAGSLHIQPPPWNRKVSKSVAIVTIQYDISDCPSWRCTYTPPAPPPPQTIQ